MTALGYALAVVACGLGATTRYLLARLDPDAGFPWPTMAANALGSAALGVAASAVAHGADATVLLVAGSGFAGGLTTFSTLAVDTVVLLRERRAGAAAGYLVGTAALGLACVAAGYGAWSLVAA
ncbi:fluoride efflux transporter FluC [Demequina sp.]|uniref:fluoride efflux transporter FluC n=1 Tax=Demequina sp. TaxID=2050685 RepID=UPI003A892746